MTKVKGSEASARLTPKSVWMAGNATMNDHMPTPPMVEIATATARRSHAVDESITCGALAPLGESMMLANPAYFRFARSTRLQPRPPFIWLISFATVLIDVFERPDSSVAGAVDSAGSYLPLASARTGPYVVSERILPMDALNVPRPAWMSEDLV